MRITHVAWFGLIVLAMIGTTIYGISLTRAPTLEHALTDDAITEEKLQRSTEIGTDTSRMDVWYFFRASDCHIGSEEISTLNALLDSGSQVHGVLLDPPGLPQESVRLIRQYGARFRVTPDTDGSWSAMLHRERYAAPLYAVVRGSRFIGAFSPDVTIRTLLPRIPGQPAVNLSTSSQSPLSLELPRRLLARLAESTNVIVPGTSLLRPELLAADSSHVYLFDYGDKLLKAFDTTGTQLWTYGNARRSNAVFSNPTDLRIDSTGDLVVYDAGRSKIVRLTSSGTLLRETSAAHGVTQAVPINDGIWLLGRDGSAFGVGIDSTGTTVSRLEIPVGLRDIDPVLRQPIAASARGGRALITGFHNTGRFAIWDDPAIDSVRFVDGIEPLPVAAVSEWHIGNALIKRVAPNAETGSLSITTDRTNFYVLFGGKTAYRYRIVDVYRIANGAYRGSYILPQEAAGIERTQDGFFVLQAGEHRSIISVRTPKLP
jgi:hypothetical protein